MAPLIFKGSESLFKRYQKSKGIYLKLLDSGKNLVWFFWNGFVAGDSDKFVAIYSLPNFASNRYLLVDEVQQVFPCSARFDEVLFFIIGIDRDADDLPLVIPLRRNDDSLYKRLVVLRSPFHKNNLLPYLSEEYRLPLNILADEQRVSYYGEMQ